MKMPPIIMIHHHHHYHHYHHKQHIMIHHHHNHRFIIIITIITTIIINTYLYHFIVTFEFRHQTTSQLQNYAYYHHFNIIIYHRKPILSISIILIITNWSVLKFFISFSSKSP